MRDREPGARELQSESARGICRKVPSSPWLSIDLHTQKKLSKLRKRIIRNEYTQQLPKFTQGWEWSGPPIPDKVERCHRTGHQVASTKGYYLSKGLN